MPSPVPSPPSGTFESLRDILNTSSNYPPIMLPGKLPIALRIHGVREGCEFSLGEALRVLQTMNKDQVKAALAGEMFRNNTDERGFESMINMLSAFATKWTTYKVRYFPYDN